MEGGSGEGKNLSLQSYRRHLENVKKKNLNVDLLVQYKLV